MRRRSAKTPTILALPTLDPSAPRFWVQRFRARPQAKEAPHLHQFFELIFIESGEGSQVIDGRRFEARAGDAFWIAPGQLHDAAGLSSTTKWIIAFSAEVLAPGQTDALSFLGMPTLPWLQPFTLGREQGRCRAVLPPALREFWMVRLEQLSSELASKPLGYAHAIQALLHLMLLDVSRLISAEGVAPGRRSPSLLEAVFLYIESNYQRPIGLRDVARAVGRSPSYLTDMTRRETGRPVVSWITERRMAEARRLLLTSEASVEEIALDVGYGDTGHFSRQFRRLTGLPPQTWRKAQHVASASGPAVAALEPKDSAPAPK